MLGMSDSEILLGDPFRDAVNVRGDLHVCLFKRRRDISITGYTASEHEPPHAVIDGTIDQVGAGEDVLRKSMISDESGKGFGGERCEMAYVIELVILKNSVDSFSIDEIDLVHDYSFIHILVEPGAKIIDADYLDFGMVFEYPFAKSTSDESCDSCAEEFHGPMVERDIRKLSLGREI